MLTPNDIGDVLEELIRKRFPGETVYREFCPDIFERPSTFLELESCGADVAFNTGAVALRPVFAATTFTEVDEYYHSHLKELSARQFALLGLVLPGFLKVGDRAPAVERTALENGYDYATVRIRFRYTLDRAEFMELEQLPLMQDLRLREEITENV